MARKQGTESSLAPIIRLRRRHSVILDLGLLSTDANLALIGLDLALLRRGLGCAVVLVLVLVLASATVCSFAVLASTLASSFTSLGRLLRSSSRSIFVANAEDPILATLLIVTQLLEHILEGGMSVFWSATIGLL
jgi:hypothetical protein